MSTRKKPAAKKPAARSSAAARTKSTTTARRPSPQASRGGSAARGGSAGRSGSSARAGSARAPMRTGLQHTRRAPTRARGGAASAQQPGALRRLARDWGRYLWAVIVAVVIAALLFEFTMIWTIGVGFYMLALGEFSGLWLLVGGYAMACTPAAFGLLIATGEFWRSLTHSLWIGLVYGALGFTFLDVILGAL